MSIERETVRSSALVNEGLIKNHEHKWQTFMECVRSSSGIGWQTCGWPRLANQLVSDLNDSHALRLKALAMLNAGQLNDGLLSKALFFDQSRVPCDSEGNAAMVAVEELLRR
jgi:hypothetical protein